MRNTMIRLITAVAALALAMGAFASSLTAHADEELSVTVEKGAVTFHNPYDEPVTISWSDNKKPGGDVVIPAGESRTIESDSQHFMYSATTADGLVGQAEWPGLDLSTGGSDQPTSPRPPSSPVPPQQGDRPGLPETGM